MIQIYMVQGQHIVIADAVSFNCDDNGYLTVHDSDNCPIAEFPPHVWYWVMNNEWEHENFQTRNSGT